MAEELNPFICDGLSLGIPSDSPTDVSRLDNVLFLDQDGELHFRDEYIRGLTDVLGNPVETVTLRDLTTRMRGVYAADGKLYFYDDTVSRPYSLEEVIGAYINWKNRLTNGGIFWTGRTQINSAECDNIIIDVEGDPSLPVNTEGARHFIKDSIGEYSPNANGTKCFSIDQYLTEAQTDDAFANGTFKTISTGEWRWHDVPNLEILIPPVDLDVSSHILAKTSVRMVKTGNPVIFRLYDETSQEELDRVAIGNDASETTEQQVTLTHVGPLTPQSEELQRIDCQCPNPDQVEIIEEEPPHTIKVQFYVNEILTENVVVSTNAALVTGGECELETTDVIKYVGAERRLIGLPNVISEDPIVNSSIDVILYNTSQKDKVGRKSGSISLSNADLAKVEFENEFSDANYSITLSCNKNINIWYTNKKPSGFTIRAEKKFTGTVDWSALKLKFEGDA